MARQGFFPTSYAAACFEPTSVRVAPDLDLRRPLYRPSYRAVANLALTSMVDTEGVASVLFSNLLWTERDIFIVITTYQMAFDEWFVQVVVYPLQIDRMCTHRLGLIKNMNHYSTRLSSMYLWARVLGKIADTSYISVSAALIKITDISSLINAKILSWSIVMSSDVSITI